MLPPEPLRESVDAATSSAAGRGRPDPRASLTRGRSSALIQDGFLAQARRSPEATALISSHGRCSYGELERISGALAARLSARGIGRGATVAIFADRNPAVVYCLLGVLRSGAAFHMIDAAYPVSRIVAYLRRTRPTFFLNAGAIAEPEALRAALGPELAEQRAIVPANAAEALAALGHAGPDAPPGPADPADVAFVVFTSGSTGTPKAIVATHAWIPHFIAWRVAHGAMTAADRFSMLSGLGHTPLLRDTFTPLSIGAALHIPDQATIFDAEAMWRWFASEQITVTSVTPAVGEILATGAPAGARLEHLRRLLWGGDVLRPSLTAQLQRVAPHLVQTNIYGTTELGQGMAYFDVADHVGDGPIPVGRGIPGAQLLVIDDHRQLCAPGEVGEIWIRSPYHSRGYLDDPEQTRACFVHNPFTDAPGDLCYRTGDRGRYLDNGAVMFAGRVDHQIKIRGFRVEPVEIAAAIERLPGVRRALVQGREVRGDPRLAAFLMCEPGAPPVAELRDALRRELPSYMIPHSWTVLADFPLLPNGKLDLLALPLPGDGEPVRGPAAGAAPATPTESRVAAIWRDVLGVAEVGRHDSFFDLGGHSLLAMQAILEMESKCCKRVTPNRFIFESLGQIARAYDETQPAPVRPASGLRGLLSGLLGGGKST